MLPKAVYYVSKVDEIGIGWFISKNVDIVNCSFGYIAQKNSDGTYSPYGGIYRYNIDGVYDYQIEANDMIVVASSGNYNVDNSKNTYNPGNKVSSPGNAYNVITVGGIDIGYKNSNGTKTFYYNHEPNASYITDDQTHIKPNISAPFEVIIPGIGYYNGTSCSAPIVTGCIALLIEASELHYAWEPEQIMSVMTATAKKTDDYIASQDYFDDRVGAGIVDLEAMIEAELPESYTQQNVAVGDEPALAYSTSIYLPANTDVTIAVAWLVNTNPIYGSEGTINSGYPYLTNYDLEIINGEYLVASSLLENSNVELVKFTTTTSGTYTIMLWQMHQIPGESLQDQISISILY